MTSATIITEVDEEIKDFSKARRRVRFKIEPDIFECVSDLPVLALIDFAAMADKVNETAMDDQMRQLFVEMFELVLKSESAPLFISRMQDKDNPISLDQVNDIMPWIMEKYGLRPTEPSDSSLDGSPTPASGPSLTANLPDEGSTSEPSALTGS